MKKTILIGLAALAAAPSFAQMKLGNAPATVQTGQLLQLEKNGTRAGLKIAEVALTGTGDVTTINIPTTAVGTLIWNTATAGSGGTAVTPGFYVWNGTAWDRVSTAAAANNLYTGDGTLAGARTVTQGTNNLTFGSTATTTTAQNLNANSLTMGTAQAIAANALTTGTGLSVTSSSNSLNSTNGLLRVANTGTSTTGTLARFQSNATAGSGMTVSNNGKVGIGTATPGSALNIVNDSTGDNSKDDLVINSFGGSSVFPGIGLYKSNGSVAVPANMTNNQTQGGIYMGGRVNNAFVLNSGITSAYRGNGTTNLSNLQFATSDTTRMTIDEKGYVGLGTTAPGTGLQIVNDGGADAKDDLFIASYGSTNPGLIMGVSAGTAAAPTNISNGALMGGTYIGGRMNNAFTYPTRIASYYKGNGTTNLSDLQISTSNIPRMTIDEDGYVGVGTTSPGAAINIVNNATGNDAKDNLTIQTYTGGSSNSPGVILLKSNGTEAAPTNLTNGNALGSVLFGGQMGGVTARPSEITSTYRGNGTTTLTDLQFKTSNATRMTIDEDGYVGIGTTTPGVALNIVNNGTGNDAKDDIQIYSYGSSTSPSLSMFNVNGTEASPTNLTNGALLGAWFMGGRVNGSTATASRIASFYRGNGTTNLSDLQFNTSNTTRMIIDQTGDVGIGTTTPGNRLEVNSGTAGASGLRFTQIDNATTPTTTNVAPLGVNANGDVVVASSTVADILARGRFTFGDVGGGAVSGISVSGNINIASVNKLDAQRIQVNFDNAVPTTAFVLAQLRGNAAGTGGAWISSQTTSSVIIQITEWDGTTQSIVIDLMVLR